MDIVYIRDPQVRTTIGIYDWEREQRQMVSLDLEMGSDNRAAAATDSIEQALNYKAVAKRLIEFIEGSEFFLVETLAERAAELVLKDFNLPWLRLRLSKPGAVTGSKLWELSLSVAIKPDPRCALVHRVPSGRRRQKSKPLSPLS